MEIRELFITVHYVLKAETLFPTKRSFIAHYKVFITEFKGYYRKKRLVVILERINPEVEFFFRGKLAEAGDCGQQISFIYGFLIHISFVLFVAKIGAPFAKTWQVYFFVVFVPGLPRIGNMRAYFCGMEKEVSIVQLFRAFESAPIEAFMEMVLGPLPKDKRDLLLFKSFSFNRGEDGIEWLKTDFNLRPFCDEEGEDPEDRWVSASVIYYPPSKLIIKHFCTRDNLPRETLEECIDHYFKS